MNEVPEGPENAPGERKRMPPPRMPRRAPNPHQVVLLGGGVLPGTSLTRSPPEVQSCVGSHCPSCRSSCSSDTRSLPDTLCGSVSPAFHPSISPAPLEPCTVSVHIRLSPSGDPLAPGPHSSEAFLAGSAGGHVALGHLHPHTCGPSSSPHPPAEPHGLCPVRLGHGLPAQCLQVRLREWKHCPLPPRPVLSGCPACPGRS